MIPQFLKDIVRELSETAQKRAAICDTCDQRKGNLCDHCGCFIDFKVNLPIPTCPLKKW